MKFMRMAFLEYIPEREGGWDVSKEWKDVFSGGEKQRVALFLILFYHKPKFAILDEVIQATSAVSSDVEGSLYNNAKDLEITLITISHRPSLLKYHTYSLNILGNDGAWELNELGMEGDEKLVSVEDEIKQIREQLNNVPQLMKRLEIINKELCEIK
ncbi:hypothetical protein ROZALSC1DRAFT_24856 [Rozella allomycis CSF55]|uniref:ABC transporter domain-containing protein n=1 Tax=Rozella allomycis (strain CSF55) TaxID=988480 RepID=A0A4V1IZ49_ROZAC|nr:hypothetical protein ROZALSC1DRAFT_24856 [Rozella allomycis CSF55]